MIQDCRLYTYLHDFPDSMPMFRLCNTRQSGKLSPFLTHHCQSFSYFFLIFLSLPCLVVNISLPRFLLTEPDRVTARPINSAYAF